MPQSLQDQVAVVTGASGGIGRAVALEFARQGAYVVLHANNRVDAATALAGQIESESGRESLVVKADLGDEAACLTLVEGAWNWRSGIDICVNVAGADVLTGDAASWPFEQKLAALWKVDVLASMTLSR